MHVLAYLLVVLTGCGAVSALASEQGDDIPLRYLFTFGDSYSTTLFFLFGRQPSVSNPFGNPPYPGHTSSGGANWVGTLVANLSLPGTLSYNLAFPGSTVSNQVAHHPLPAPDFVAQTSQFTTVLASRFSSAKWNGENSVFACWFGTNDINLIFKGEEQDPSLHRARRIFDSHFAQLERLHAFGARRFMLINMHPLERIPMYMEASDEDVVAIKEHVEEWNSLMHDGALAFQTRHRDVTLDVLDAHAVFTGVLNNPEGHGAPNSTCFNADGTSCLWWNNLHPGYAIQAAIAHAAFDILTKQGFYGEHEPNRQQDSLRPTIERERLWHGMEAELPGRGDEQRPLVPMSHWP